MIQILIPTRVHAGTAFRMIREAMNIPMKAAASELNFSEVTLHGIESGKTYPKRERMSKLCDYYGIDLYLVISMAYTSNKIAQRMVTKIISDRRVAAIKKGQPKRINKKRVNAIK